MEINILASGSSGNAYLLQDGRSRLLIECGITPKELTRQLWKMGITVSMLDGCLISHAHGDHCKAVQKLMDRGVDCYMSDKTAEELGLHHHRIMAINSRVSGEFNIGREWTIKAFEAVHDIPCIGFVITSGEERLLYLIDSAYSPYTFPGLTQIMVGCNYDMDILNENIESGRVNRGQKSRLIHSHASLNTIKDMLEANDLSKVEEIYLLHLSDRNADEERFKREIQEVTGKVVHVC